MRVTLSIVATLLVACVGTASVDPIDNDTNYDIGLEQRSDYEEPDLAPKTKTCAELVECVKVCTDRACIDGCARSGTDEGREKFLAVDRCLQDKLAGACKGDCEVDQESKECFACTAVLCKEFSDACLRVGPGTASFGDTCDLQAPQCNDGLLCLNVTGASDGKGLCTRICTEGAPCDGAPTGTEAACILVGPAKTAFCGFLCLSEGQTFECPTELTCSATELPPGSGQKPCQP